MRTFQSQEALAETTHRKIHVNLSPTIKAKDKHLVFFLIY